MQTRGRTLNNPPGVQSSPHSLSSGLHHRIAANHSEGGALLRRDTRTGCYFNLHLPQKKADGACWSTFTELRTFTKGYRAALEERDCHLWDGRKTVCCLFSWLTFTTARFMSQAHTYCLWAAARLQFKSITNDEDPLPKLQSDFFFFFFALNSWFPVIRAKFSLRVVLSFLTSLPLRFHGSVQISEGNCLSDRLLSAEQETMFLQHWKTIIQHN